MFLPSDPGGQRERLEARHADKKKELRELRAVARDTEGLRLSATATADKLQSQLFTTGDNLGSTFCGKNRVPVFPWVASRANLLY